MTNRYNRHIILKEIGPEGQQNISNAKVLVIGTGGLGCPVLQYLAAAGVGTLGIIDFDLVELSNLQRQILFGTASLGKNKALAAKERLKDLNNEITINAYPEALTYQNAIELFEQYDIIVDGSDNFETRYLVNDACILVNKPFVFGAIYKFEGQVSVFNYKDGPSYRCLFPKAPKKGNVPNCSDVGVLGVLPGIIGSMQANEVLKIILGIGNVLTGKVLFYNALTHQSSTLKIKKNFEVIQNILEHKADFNTQGINLNCANDKLEISVKDLDLLSDIQIVDVREAHELPKITGVEVLHIPLGFLEHKVFQLDDSKPTICFCQTGIRSKKAVTLLKAHKFQNCFSLMEGASEINNFLREQHNIVSNDR